MQTKSEDKTLYTKKQTQALGLYLRQCTAAEIAGELGCTDRAVQRWVKNFGWAAMRDDAPAELVLRQRITYLMWVDEKSDRLLKELDVLLKHQFGEVKARGGSAKDGSNRGRPANKTKNDVSKVTAEMLAEYREQTFFKYQLKIWQTKQDDALNWMRFYLKSRQIGLTYYFAFEAFEDAIITGDNQIFLSASKKQSEIFKAYIRMFALKIGDVDLKGKDEITLSNGATFYFLSTNSRTAQGYHGHLYVDEVFWIPKFKELDDLAGGMSMHDKWRTTYLSTPSTIAHEAYPKWSGTKKDAIDISHKALKDGALGVDGIYRQVITVDDAIEGGADFFNMDKLRKKYPDADIFNNLLRCMFLDNSNAVFKIGLLMACKVDTDAWKDISKTEYRPVGNSPVWLGYDPSGEGDEAAVIAALPPARPGGAFRLIEKLRLQGESYEYQAAQIENLCHKYNVTEIAMDATGMGDPVAKLVSKFFPAVTCIIYSINTKDTLVYKTREVISGGRLLFSDDWDDVIHSFLMIKRTTTRGGRSTFGAARSKDSSHADIAMAIMNLLSLEGVDNSQKIKPMISTG